MREHHEEEWLPNWHISTWEKKEEQHRGGYFKQFTMKKLVVFVLFINLQSLNFASNIDSINGDANVVLQEEKAASEIEIPLNKKKIGKEQNQQSGKSLQEQAEEIPVVFGQWWFWVGLFAVVLFLKLVIFKK